MVALTDTSDVITITDHNRRGCLGVGSETQERSDLGFDNIMYATRVNQNIDEVT